jgi:Flp pilus assembly protein TadG
MAIHGRRYSERGVAAVEFAVVVTVFLVILFGLLEVVRAMYVVNTLPEVTRRAAAAAAKVDFTNAAALDQVRQNAVFRESAGDLPLGLPVTDANVIIDYMSISKGADGSLSMVPISALPSSTAASRAACFADPYSANCVQFVRVRICASADANGCTPLDYVTLFPLISLPLKLPSSTTIVKTDSLGLSP